MVKSLVIRDAELTDTAALSKLAYEIWHEHYVPIVGREQVEYMLDLWYNDEALRTQMSDPTRSTKLVENVQGELIGYIQYGRQEEAMFVYKVYIASDYRGKGIGKHLFGQIQHRPLTLRVNKNNKDSIAFYKRYGFEVTAEEVLSIGAGFVRDDYVMQCDR